MKAADGRPCRCDYGCGTQCRCELPCLDVKPYTVVQKGPYYVPIFLCDFHKGFAEIENVGKSIEALLAVELDSPGWIFDGRRIVLVDGCGLPLEEAVKVYSWKGSLCETVVHDIDPEEKPITVFRRLEHDER